MSLERLDMKSVSLLKIHPAKHMAKNLTLKPSKLLNQQ